MKKKYSNDPVLQRVHENCERILWICRNKKPYPKHADPANEEEKRNYGADPYDIFNQFFGGKQ